MFVICSVFHPLVKGAEADHLNFRKPGLCTVCVFGTVFKVPASFSARISRAPGLGVGMIQDSCKHTRTACRKDAETPLTR